MSREQAEQSKQSREQAEQRASRAESKQSREQAEQRASRAESKQSREQAEQKASRAESKQSRKQAGQTGSVGSTAGALWLLSLVSRNNPRLHYHPSLAASMLAPAALLLAALLGAEAFSLIRHQAPVRLQAFQAVLLEYAGNNGLNNCRMRGRRYQASLTTTTPTNPC